jgi:ATP-binding cassette, subfamily B, bacterial
LIIYEVGQLSGYITGTLLSIIPLLLTALGLVVLMFRIDPLFAGLVAILIPLFYLLLSIMGRRLRPLAIELQQAHATAVAAAEENLGMLPAIKTFTREAEQSRRYRQQIHQVRELSITQQRIYAAA